MKKFLIICSAILLLLVIYKYYCYDKKNNYTAELVTSENIAESNPPNGIVMYEPDFSNITFADTAKILDSLRAEREHLSTPTTCCVNLWNEIQMRLIIDSLEMEKFYSTNPHHPRIADRPKFLKEIDEFYEMTKDAYNQVDSTDPWNSFYAATDVLNKVIIPHTKGYVK